MGSSIQRLFYVIAVPLVVALAVLAIYNLVLKPTPGDPDLQKAESVVDSESGEGESAPNISVRRPEISHLVDGRVTWQVFADTIESDTATGRTSLLGSSGVFYRDEQDPEEKFEFTSPVTFYNDKTKEVEAHGGVSGRLVPESYQLEAESMRWSESNGTLMAEGVKLISDDAVLTGGRMEIDPEGETIRLTGGVKVNINVRRGGG